MLSREEVIAIASKLAGVFFAVLATKSAVETVPMLDFEYPYTWLLLSVVVAIPLFAFLVLWFFPLTVARKLLPVMKKPGTPISKEGTSLIGIGCTLLGIWLFMSALSDSAYWTVRTIIIYQQDYEFSLPPGAIAAIVATVVELGTAIWLICGYDGILRTIKKLRTAGA